MYEARIIAAHCQTNKCGGSHRMIDTSTHLDHRIQLRAEFYSDLPCFLLNWMAVLWTARMPRGNLPLVFGRQRGHQETAIINAYTCGICGPPCVHKQVQVQLSGG